MTSPAAADGAVCPPYEVLERLAAIDGADDGDINGDESTLR